QRLRNEGLIIFRGGQLTILDMGGLQRAAGFDPSYLHIRRRVAVGTKHRTLGDTGWASGVRYAPEMVNPAGLTRQGSHVSDPKI
ncbi:MAG TPA: hypothetical protein VFT40_07370, partial [Sphingomicrobium sp.]|nr:hypothetical protein [Sphingomicrobium sp.]